MKKPTAKSWSTYWKTTEHIRRLQTLNVILTEETDLCVIFLDIEGVLKPRGVLLGRSLSALSHVLHTQLWVLRRILKKTKAKLVISSPWRQNSATLSLIVELLRITGTIKRAEDVIGVTKITGDISGETPPQRGALILEWLSQLETLFPPGLGFDLSWWLVIDGHNLPAKGVGIPEMNMLTTDPDLGLEEKHIKKAVALKKAMENHRAALRELESVETFFEETLSR